MVIKTCLKRIKLKEGIEVHLKARKTSKIWTIRAKAYLRKKRKRLMILLKTIFMMKMKMRNKVNNTNLKEERTLRGLNQEVIIYLLEERTKRQRIKTSRPRSGLFQWSLICLNSNLMCHWLFQAMIFSKFSQILARTRDSKLLRWNKT